MATPNKSPFAAIPGSSGNSFIEGLKKGAKAGWSGHLGKSSDKADKEWHMQLLQAHHGMNQATEAIRGNNALAVERQRGLNSLAIEQERGRAAKSGARSAAKLEATRGQNAANLETIKGTNAVNLEKTRGRNERAAHKTAVKTATGLAGEGRVVGTYRTGLGNFSFTDSIPTSQISNVNAGSAGQTVPTAVSTPQVPGSTTVGGAPSPSLSFGKPPSQKAQAAFAKQIGAKPTGRKSKKVGSNLTPTFQAPPAP
jgi:hypothetical protein